jgi:hypothetical protein
MLIDNVWICEIHGDVKKEIKPLSAHKKPGTTAGRVEEIYREPDRVRDNVV